ncbi:MAG TPA: hypothetical protein PLV68_02950 [Ilumatobacteraceae bacterium]|nr:hypothetical protein [Ilumatobacteraceae bacterium]
MNAHDDPRLAAQEAGVTVAPAASLDELGVLQATTDAVWVAEIAPPRNMRHRS